ncbi:MAG: TlpA family protein disulfide reductase [Flavobacteriales bacterium]|nr:TlpA family protein disulfide reductase [Flavobacteriales bacterium]MEB2340459.1 TlpA disulfide reductase family protein [Flavobacteriia bacterium]
MRNLFLLSALLISVLASAQSGKLPDVTVQNMNGQKVSTATWNNGGKPMIINFWATWCAPCKRELNAINDLYPDWQKETGVKLMAVSIDDTRSMNRVKPYVNGQAWDYEIFLDPNGDLKRALNVNNIPHTFLVDGKGNIVWQHNNYEPGDEKQLYQQVKKLAGKG